MAIAEPEMGLESIANHSPLSGVLPDLRLILARLFEKRNSYTPNTHQRSGEADLRIYILISSVLICSDLYRYCHVTITVTETLL